MGMERQTITVEEAAQILGIGRSSAYEGVCHDLTIARFVTLHEVRACPPTGALRDAIGRVPGREALPALFDE
jgi:hypothetical protein